MQKEKPTKKKPENNIDFFELDNLIKNNGKVISKLLQ
jgi:hypothetical protein